MVRNGKQWYYVIGSRVYYSQIENKSHDDTRSLISYNGAKGLIFLWNKTYRRKCQMEFLSWYFACLRVGTENTKSNSSNVSALVSGSTNKTAIHPTITKGVRQTDFRIR